MPLQKKYGDYYAACMNQPLADQLGTKPVQPLLKQVDDFNDKKQLATLLGTIEYQNGGGFLYGFYSGQDQKDSTKVIPQLTPGRSFPCRTGITTSRAMTRDRQCFAASMWNM